MFGQVSQDIFSFESPSWHNAADLWWCLCSRLSSMLFVFHGTVGAGHCFCAVECLKWYANKSSAEMLRSIPFNPLCFNFPYGLITKAPLDRSIIILSFANSEQSMHSKPYWFSVHTARSHGYSFVNQSRLGFAFSCLSSVNQPMWGYFSRCWSTKCSSCAVINVTPGMKHGTITGRRTQDSATSCTASIGSKFPTAPSSAGSSLVDDKDSGSLPVLCVWHRCSDCADSAEHRYRY